MSTDIFSSQSTSVTGQPIPSQRPVWMWRDATKDRHGFHKYSSSQLRSETTLQYFGARWDPSPEDMEEPAWRHQFFLVGTGYSAHRGYTSKSTTKGIEDQSFSVKRGTIGDPTIVQQHDTTTIGFIPPEAFMDEILSDTTEAEFAEFILGSLGTIDQIDYFDAAEQLNAEVTDVTDMGGPLQNLNTYAGLVLLGAGVLSGGLVGAGIAALAASRILLNHAYNSRRIEDGVFLPEGFEHSLTTDPSFAQMHFAGFEVLTPPSTTGDVQISSSFSGEDLGTTIDFKVEIPSSLAPDTVHSCQDLRDIVRDHARTPSTLGDHRGMVLKSPGQPDIAAVTPKNYAQFNPGEAIPMGADLGDDVIEHRWYASHEEDSWCRVNSDRSTSPEYAFEKPGRANVALYARNDAGLSTLKNYRLEIGEVEDTEEGDGDEPIDISIEKTIGVGEGDDLGNSTVTLDARDTVPETGTRYEWELQLLLEDGVKSADGHKHLPAGEYEGKVWNFERGQGEYRAKLTVSKDGSDQKETEFVRFSLPDVDINPEVTIDVGEGAGAGYGESRAYLNWETETPNSWVSSSEWTVYDDLSRVDGLPVSRNEEGTYFDAGEGEYTVSVKLTDTAENSYTGSQVVTLPDINTDEDDDNTDDDDDDSTSEKPDPPDANISGPLSVDLGDTATWAAFDSTGGTDLTYTWSGDVSGSGPSSTTETVGSCDFTVTLTVEDEYGQKDSQTRRIGVNSEFCGPSI